MSKHRLPTVLQGTLGHPVLEPVHFNQQALKSFWQSSLGLHELNDPQMEPAQLAACDWDQQVFDEHAGAVGQQAKVIEELARNATAAINARTYFMITLSFFPVSLFV